MAKRADPVVGKVEFEQRRAEFKRAEWERVKPAFLDTEMQERYDRIVEQYVECEIALRGVYHAKAFNMLPRAVQDRVRAAMGETTRR